MGERRYRCVLLRRFPELLLWVSGVLWALPRARGGVRSDAAAVGGDTGLRGGDAMLVLVAAAAAPPERCRRIAVWSGEWSGNQGFYLAVLVRMALWLTWSCKVYKTPGSVEPFVCQNFLFGHFIE